MIIDFDRNPALSGEQKLQSLMESVQLALTSIETDVAQKGKRLTEIGSQLTKILQWMGSTKRISTRTVFSNHAFQGTSTGWQYIGKSFTVPAGEAYLAWMTCGFNSGKPIGGGFNSASTLNTAWGVPDRGYIENASGIARTPVFYLDAGTYYVFCKRATTPNANNNHAVYATRIFT